MNKRALLAALWALLLVCSAAQAQTTTTSTSSSTTTTLSSSGGSGVLVAGQSVTGATLTILCVDRTRPASLTFLIDAGTSTSTVIQNSADRTLWVPAAAAVTADGVVAIQNPSGCYRALTTVTSGTVTIHWSTSTRQ